MGIYTEKLDGEMMLLVTVSRKSTDFGKSGNRETQVRKSICKQIERVGQLFGRANVKHREINTEIGCRDDKIGELFKIAKKMTVAYSELFQTSKMKLL